MSLGKESRGELGSVLRSGWVWLAMLLALVAGAASVATYLKAGKIPAAGVLAGIATLAAFCIVKYFQSATSAEEIREQDEGHPKISRPESKTASAAKAPPANRR